MIIPRGVLRQIRRVLETAYPHEGCGLLVGQVNGDIRVHRHVAVANGREEDGAAATRYLISPHEFREVNAVVASGGLEIVGVYHSHPDVPPHPSAFDRELAWPWYQYLIITVERGRAGSMRAWQLTDDRRGFVERPVRIVD